MEEEYKQITQLNNLVSDLEKENKELRKELSDLKTTIEDTPNNFELGEKVRHSYLDWDEEMSNEDPLFAKVYSNLKAFREKYAIWGDRAYLK